MSGLFVKMDLSKPIQYLLAKCAAIVAAIKKDQTKAITYRNSYTEGQSPMYFDKTARPLRIFHLNSKGLIQRDFPPFLTDIVFVDLKQKKTICEFYFTTNWFYTSKLLGTFCTIIFIALST